METILDDIEADNPIIRNATRLSIVQEESEYEEYTQSNLKPLREECIDKSTDTLGRSIEILSLCPNDKSSIPQNSYCRKTSSRAPSVDITDASISKDKFQANLTSYKTSISKKPIQNAAIDSIYRIGTIEKDPRDRVISIGDISNVDNIHLESLEECDIDECSSNNGNLSRWTGDDFPLNNSADDAPINNSLPVDSCDTLKATSNASMNVLNNATSSASIQPAEKIEKKQKWYRTLEIPMFKNLYRDEKNSTKLKTPDDSKRSSSAGRIARKSSQTFFRLLIPHGKSIASTTSKNLKDKNASAIQKSLSDFANEEKERFESEYTVQNQLGSGGHSTVRLAIRRSDSLKVVLKFIHSSSVWHWHRDEQTNRKIPLEIYMMKTLSGNPNIIHYIDHFEMGVKFIIAMEYLGEDWVDLYDYIEMFGPVSEPESIEIFKRVTNIAIFLNKKDLCHNDIKDENVMINTKTKDLKLIDFGSMTKLERGVSVKSFYGTKKFSSPEALKGPYLPEFQEVWALGTLFYVLLFKMDPFKNDDEVLFLDISKRIERIRLYGINGEKVVVSNASVECILKMLDKDWSKRPKIQQLSKLQILK